VAGLNFSDVEKSEGRGGEAGMLVGPFSFALTFGENESGNFVNGLSFGFGGRGLGLGAFGTETKTVRVPVVRP
jgi:hypothetical protein